MPGQCDFAAAGGNYHTFSYVELSIEGEKQAFLPFPLSRMICVHAVAKILKEEYKYSKFQEHNKENAKNQISTPWKNNTQIWCTS